MMNEELEIRLRSAFHGATLPAARPELFEALDAVVAEPVHAGSNARNSGFRTGRRSWGILAVAAVLLVGGAIALSVGNPGPEPAPSVQPSVAPSDSPEPASATRLTYQPQWTSDVPFNVDDLAALVAITRQRLDATGVVGVVVSTDDEARVVVDVPPGIDGDPLRALIGQVGAIAFVPVGPEAVEVGAHLDRTLFPPLFDGGSIEAASLDADSTGSPALLIRLDAEAATAFADYTAAHVGEWFAITIDDAVISAPIINVPIPNGDVLISFGGLPTEHPDLDALVAVIRNGPLPVALVEIERGLAPSQPAAADPAVVCDPRLQVEGPQLECEDALASALAILPPGHPAIAKVAFVHECNDVRFGAPDCYVPAFGVVTVTWADGSPPVRIQLSLGTQPTILPPLPTASG